MEFQVEILDFLQVFDSDGYTVACQTLKFNCNLERNTKIRNNFFKIRHTAIHLNILIFSKFYFKSINFIKKNECLIKNFWYKKTN